MRGILMVLLGGGLLWLVLENFGIGEGESVEAGGLSIVAGEPGPGATGAMPAGASRPLAGEHGELLQRPPADPARKDVAPSPPQETPAARPVVRDDSPGQGVRGALSPIDEAEAAAVLAGGPEDALAGVLLHDRRRLPSFLENEGKDLSQSRRDLALALALAIEGRPEVARRYATKLDGAGAISGRERDFLAAALEGRAVPASWSRGGTLIHAASVAMRAEEGGRLLTAGRWAEAAAAFSDVLLAEVQAPWQPDRESLAGWSEKLARAQSRHRFSREGSWPAVEIEVRSGDNLTAIRKRVLREHPDLRFCTGLIDRANELGGRYLRIGETLRIPRDEVHAEVFLRAHCLLLMIGEEVLVAYEVGIGKPGKETRVGSYVAGLKQKEPTWFPLGEPPVPFGDPMNPLGTRWIAWHLADDGAATSLGFHGTNDPTGVGGDVSRGCIRLRNEHVEELYELMPLGGRVVVHP